MLTLDNLGQNFIVKNPTSNSEVDIHMKKHWSYRKIFKPRISVVVALGEHLNYKPSRGPSNYQDDVIFCFHRNQQYHITPYYVASRFVI